MNLKKMLITAALGVGIGAFALPAAALADVNASPGTVRPGGTVQLRASCNPGVNGNAEVIGPARMQTFNITLNAASDGARGQFTVPGGTASNGTWHVTATCGGSAAGKTTFTVAPTGAPRGGDGGATDTAMVTAGTALVGAAAAGGGYLLMRRRAASTL